MTFGAGIRAVIRDALRAFQLIYDRNFYSQRLEKLRNVEMARRNRERLKNPSAFPSVPSGDI